MSFFGMLALLTHCIRRDVKERGELGGEMSEPGSLRAKAGS